LTGKEKLKMGKNKVCLGIIGAGAVAQVAHLPAFKRIPQVEVLALCDIDESKLRKVAEKHGIKKIYTDFEDLLQLEELDGVVIAVPNYLHAPMTIAALQHGKHVLCEKPMAMRASEAREMVKAATQAQKKLMIGFNHRFRPDVQVLKKFIERGELGEIFYIKTGWLRRRTEWSRDSWLIKTKSAGGGVFLDLGAHMLDLALWLAGDPKVLTASAVTYRKGKGYDVEDSGSAFIRLEGGAILSIEVSWTLIFDKDLTYVNFFGTRGAALLNPLRIHKELHGHLVNVTPITKFPQNVHKASFEEEALHFVECIRENKEPIFSGKDGVVITEILDAIYQSAKTGKEVELSNFQLRNP